MLHVFRDMSLNGNGNSARLQVLQARKKAAATASAPEAVTTDKNSVTFKTSEGVVRGSPAHVQRHMAVFELYGPTVVPRLSESLADFKIVLQEREIYSGHAVVRNIVDAGAKIVCEVSLELMDWVDLDLLLAFREGQAENEIKVFLNEWQKNYRIPDEFKIVVADMQAFFHDLRLLLDRMELRLQAQSPSFRDDTEGKMVRPLADAVLPLIDFFFEKFEDAAKRIREDDQSACMNYLRQRLHPLVLSAPFANHTITKPRGYAGDYEMVNMIVRDGFEGDSLFAKIFHYWFVQQPPAQAHRNRIQYLAACIETEVQRVARMGRAPRPARILNFACGPALDVQRFASHSILANEADFTLEDFDDQALAHCQNALLKIFNTRRLDTLAAFKRKSIYQLVKESQMPGWPPQKRYDLVYCAGLFDYLAESTCKQLMDIFYDQLAPGGLLLVTNVNSTNPLRYGMEHLLDWHLIYRNEAQIRALVPSQALPENARVRADETGVNLFLEVRKPEYA
jgi:extracellular factor (EF) 3-hydroxypalmitic acid methyl ester biosynthesis protein